MGAFWKRCWHVRARLRKLSWQRFLARFAKMHPNNVCLLLSFANYVYQTMLTSVCDSVACQTKLLGVRYFVHVWWILLRSDAGMFVRVWWTRRGVASMFRKYASKRCFVFCHLRTMSTSFVHICRVCREVLMCICNMTTLMEALHWHLRDCLPSNCVFGILLDRVRQICW